MSLAIHWDSGSAQLKPNPSPDPKGFLEMIRLQLAEKCQPNFRGQLFISRRDQNPFQASEVVDKLVASDGVLENWGPAYKREFVASLIARPAVKLLLICVYSAIPLWYLAHLLDKHDCDDWALDEWLLGKQYIDCTDGGMNHCRNYTSMVAQHKGVFHVRDVTMNYEHRILDDTQVMPLQFTGNNGKIEKLGSGASSEVYKVSIDCGHHRLSGVCIVIFFPHSIRLTAFPGSILSFRSQRVSFNPSTGIRPREGHAENPCRLSKPTYCSSHLQLDTRTESLYFVPQGFLQPTRVYAAL
jgi:hypothetical protein